MFHVSLWMSRDRPKAVMEIMGIRFHSQGRQTKILEIPHYRLILHLVATPEGQGHRRPADQELGLRSGHWNKEPA